MKSDSCFVLVHGAFHGGWCWRGVRERLSAAGGRIFTPTLTGLGERRHLVERAGLSTWIDDVVNTIEFEELDRVVLVGHSIAGGVVSGVADRIPHRLRHLVYLDAGLAEPGRSLLDENEPADVEARRRMIDPATGLMAVPPPPVLSALMGVTEPASLARMARLLTPQPFSPYEAVWALDHPLGNGVPTTYVRCIAPASAHLDSSVALARAQAGWTYTELAAGHDAMIDRPDLTAELLLAIG